MDGFAVADRVFLEFFLVARTIVSFGPVSFFRLHERLETDIGGADAVRLEGERTGAAGENSTRFRKALRDWTVSKEPRLHIAEQRDFLNARFYHGHEPVVVRLETKFVQKSIKLGGLRSRIE